MRYGHWRPLYCHLPAHDPGFSSAARDADFLPVPASGHSNHWRLDETGRIDRRRHPWEERVAWYGHRQSVWITPRHQPATRANPDSRETIFNINDNDKQVKGLYLTAETIDSRFLTDWIHAGELSWGSFILDFVNLGVAPPDFPIREAPIGFMPEQLFLADWKRWRQ